MKNTKAQINLKMLLLIGVIIVLLVVGLGGTASIFNPNFDFTKTRIIGQDNSGVKYSHTYVIGGYDPISKTSPIGCGCACSYDYTIKSHPKTQSELPGSIEGLVEKQWFEGEVTQKPSLMMVVKPNSDISSSHALIINNTKVYCSLEQFGKYGSLTCRYTGNIYAKDNHCGSVYGTLYSASEVKIPYQDYLNQLNEEEKQEEIITESEIKEEIAESKSKEDIVLNSQEGISFLDKLKNFWSKITQWFKS